MSLTLPQACSTLSDTKAILERIAATDDLEALHDAYKVEKLTFRRAAILNGLKAAILAISGQNPSEVPVSFADVAGGAADAYLQDAIAQVIRRIEKRGEENGKGSMTLKIDITVNALSNVALSIHEPTVKLPKLNGKGENVRVHFDGDGTPMPVLDIDENADRSRKIPLFPNHN